MRWSRLTLLVALYVTLDVANPMMPGALVFGIEESVEVRQADRSRVHDEAPALAPAYGHLVLSEPNVAPRRPAMVAARFAWTRIPHARLLPPSPAPSPEDH